MSSKNEVLCAAAGRLAAERSEADKPAKAHKTIFAPNNIIVFFLQTFITNYLRHVKKPGTLQFTLQPLIIRDNKFTDALSGDNNFTDAPQRR
jgi:hypothetical protein